LTYSVYELEELLLRRLTSETKKGRKGKQSRVAEVWMSRLEPAAHMRKNTENLFLRKLYGLVCEVRSPDPFLQSADVLSC